MTHHVSVRARFERFPATLKGAFIIRGEDRDPHQVVLLEGRAVSVDGRAVRRIPMQSTTLDIVPKQDVFVPFELSVSDLEPGWYDLVCDLQVDGIFASQAGGRRFTVAWPRASVRRGQVKVGKELRLGDVRVRVEQVDCGADSIRLQLSIEPPEELTVRLSADGDPLDVLETDLDLASGRARVVAYPVLKVHRTLRVEVRGRGRDAHGTVDVPFPV
ncbi:MAG: hypothetical protein ACE14W_08690 [Candidatus Velamenicoccus archaeovorus]